MTNRLFSSLSVVLISACISFTATAQQNIGGKPISFSPKSRLDDADVPLINMPLLDMQMVASRDSANEELGNVPYFSYLMPVAINLQNSGEWETLYNGDRVWRLAIKSKYAKALTLLYSNFHMPEGARLYIYNEDHSQVLGGFTSINNKPSGEFATGILAGDVSYLEYYEPASVSGEGVIDISHVGHAYRFVEDWTRGSDPCQVNVNCSEGNNWQDEKKGVVRIVVVSNQGQGLCTGSLVNNTNLDCKNYILTALHCGVSSTASHFNQYIFYFNYERSGCNSGGVTSNQSITGCTARASSNDGGGNSGSDYLLVELNNSIPSSYNPYYNGWNASTTASGSGVGIHHPSGDIKKISTYNSTLTTTGWGISGTHWRVYWIATANGHGVTEGGSSGSPLFNSQGQIVGTLTGGGSYCSQTPNPDPDAYGKMSYHWASNSNGQQLKNYLAPGSSATSLNGTYAPCTPALARDMSVTAVVEPTGTICSTSITPIVTIKNLGSLTITTLTINYNVDGGTNQTYNWTGSLATNASTNVTLPSMTVSAGAHTFNASTSNPNGGVDGNTSNDGASGSFTTVVANDYVTLVINTDNYGSETTWELKNAQNTTLYTGGPYANNTHYELPLCVPGDACYTFTIYDTPQSSAGDGICCEYGDGSYSIGLSDGVSVATGGEFGASETTNFCIPAPSATCDTIVNTNFLNASGYGIYPLNAGGYVTGTNDFGDLAKAQVFPVSTPVDIDGVIMWFAAKENNANNTNSRITVNLHQLDGPGTASSGAVNNAPGTVLASATVNLSKIDTSGFYTRAMFSSPVTVSNDYAIGVNFSTLGNNDEVGLYSSADGDANNTELAWEQWDTGAWHTLLEAWSQTIDGDIDLGIFPIECTTTITDVYEPKTEDIAIYPNPTNSSFTVDFNLDSQSDVNISVYNTIGTMVYNTVENGLLNDKVLIDLSNEASGLYFVNMNLGDKNITKKVMLKK